MPRKRCVHLLQPIATFKYSSEFPSKENCIHTQGIYICLFYLSFRLCNPHPHLHIVQALFMRHKQYLLTCNAHLAVCFFEGGDKDVLVKGIQNNLSPNPFSKSPVLQRAQVFMLRVVFFPLLILAWSWRAALRPCFC